LVGDMGKGGFSTVIWQGESRSPGRRIPTKTAVTWQDKPITRDKPIE
jgi:hypothetical protein